MKYLITLLPFLLIWQGLRYGEHIKQRLHSGRISEIRRLRVTENCMYAAAAITMVGLVIYYV